MLGGDIGNIPRAMVGGLLLGVIEALGAAYISDLAWKDAIAFVVLILILIIRPDCSASGWRRRYEGTRAPPRRPPLFALLLCAPLALDRYWVRTSPATSACTPSAG